MTDDERAIRELVSTWFTATRNGDLATVLDLMADDVVFMVPGGEPFGKEAFAAASKGMKDVRIDGTSDIREIQVLGDWAYLRSYLKVTMALPDQDTPMRLYADDPAQGARRAMASGARRQFADRGKVKPLLQPAAPLEIQIWQHR